jgi:hypothetical protein
MRWRTAVGITVGLFAAGVALGYVAQKRGVPRDQIGRWAVKEATRKALQACDVVRDLLPDDRSAVSLRDAIAAEPTRPGPGLPA